MAFMLTEFIQYFQIILNMIIYTKLGFFVDDSKIQVEKKNQDIRWRKRLPSFSYRSIQRDEVEIVMGNLGVICKEGENFPKSFSCNDLLNMFDEEQPRLDEVKEAFDVFDENKDGYIDARELQRVLSALGLMDHRVDMDDCKKMIRVFDNNNDGRIDFVEFVKFMEGSLC